MTNKEKAIQFMESLRLHTNVVKELKEGIVNASERGGFLYWASDEENEKIAELQKDGNVVWHLIRGRYVFDGTEKCDMTAYLLTTDEDAEDIELIDGQAEVFAYIENLTWPECSEYGYIWVRPRFGGLERIA